MIDQGKRNLLGVLIDAVDYEAAVERVLAAARARRSFALSALAVHGVMTGVLDATHRYRLNRLDLVAPDGQPVRWALNVLHHARLPDRVYGPTLTLMVCERAAAEELPVYFYGSRAEVLERLTQRLQARFPGLIIAGAQPSRFRQVTPDEQRAIAAAIAASGAAITFVGLGCPRQEVWAYEHRELLSMPVLAVGAAFDFHAGTLPQAPAILQRVGLEWAFRLAQEPRRLWQRYLYLNPLYLWMVLLQATGITRFDPDRAIAPEAPLCYG
ncbi:MAG: WecB/TagA/CpsF family glycosyltransferase [Oscillochloridaceae bacterium]|nr:WecB/TagA/CpsF family glycosyltransferase [Chloroflexaceae bacterium]MDW8389318.1 WecB/TagA/CpsF family glycosyltransferase [Oscillochloridaceae bacterium]